MRYTRLGGKEMQKKQRYKDANTTGNHDILGTCAACWYEQDGLGGVQRLINRCGGVRSSYAYTAWGIPLNWRETIPNRYTFTSREYNAESGDYYYRARHYTPTLGRFTTRDPLDLIHLFRSTLMWEIIQ